jgi:tetratricopeptide (TPR) repeat protein
VAVQSANTLLAEALHARSAGQFAQAAELFERALYADPHNAKALCHFAALLADARAFERAEVLLVRAIELAPKLGEAHATLALALHGQRRFGDAIAACERGLKSAPGHPLLLFNYAVNLQDAGRHADALSIAQKILKRAPTHAQASYVAATACDKLGDVKGMLVFYTRAAELAPNDATYLVSAADALLRAGRAAEALQRLEAALRLRPWEVRALALKTLALAELGRGDEERRLSDPERLTHALDIGQIGIAGEALAALNRDLAAYSAAHPSMREDPPENATYRAWHSGDLAAAEHPALDRLRAFIRFSFEERAKSLAGEDPAHPFARAVPKNYSLHLWSVRMVGGSKMVPHIHTSGWLSGVYYAEVPAVCADPAAGQAGWLKIGPARLDIPMTRQPLTAAFQPQPGRMLTFPSYFWHDTVPLPEGDRGQRICFAWDLQPRA